MKILQVTPLGRSGQGGIDRVADLIESIFDDDDYSIFLRLPTWNAVFRLRFLGFLMAVVRLPIICYSNKPIIHIHISQGGSILRKGILLCISRPFSEGSIIHLHGSRFAQEYSDGNLLYKWITRLVFKQATRVVVLGDSVRSFVIDNLGVAPDAVKVIRNAVPEIFSDGRGNRRTPSNAEAELKLLFLGEIGFRKGFDVLLEALSVLPNRPISLIAAGDGDLDFFRGELIRLNLESKVTISHWLSRDELIDVMAEVDVLVLPSRAEALPMAMLEAMSASLPVIVTPVGAIGEVITHQQNGLLVAPGSSASLARAIDLLVEDRVLLSSLGDSGYQTYVKEFSLRLYKLAMKDLYKQVRGY